MSAPHGIAKVIGLVCVLHVLALWFGGVNRRQGDAAVPYAPALSTRWVLPPAARGDEPATAAAALSRKPARAARRVPSRAAETQPTIVDASPVAREAARPSAVEPPSIADSIQRAARESARHKGLAELSDERLSEQPADAQAALRHGMTSAARSDCLKGGEGGYANGGLGLFALPLLMLDAARGRCK